MNKNNAKNCTLHTDKWLSLWWINAMWPKPRVCPSGLVFTDVQPERMKHHNVCQALYETSTCVSKHCIKHDHMCLTLCAACPCVSFIMWETWPCLPFIKWNMSTYAYHYMTSISLHAVIFTIIMILVIAFIQLCTCIRMQAEACIRIPHHHSQTTT